MIIISIMDNNMFCSCGSYKYDYPKIKTIIDPTIDYKREYKLCKASLIQIILAISKIDEKRTDNDIYKQHMKNFYSQYIPELIEDFEKCLISNCAIDEYVKNGNLLVNLPKGCIINYDEKGNNLGYEHNIKIGSALLGKKLIPALKQRIIYIINNESPYYENSPHSLHYEELKQQLNKFLIKVLEFERNFVVNIRLAHKKKRLNMINPILGNFIQGH